MSRVEEIEAAIDGVPPEEYRRVVEWFRVREQRRWDEQMDADSSTGKLDFLFDEAESESANGPLREWPPQA
jgi:DNA-binding transcriptional regulator YdaS (Cro superfamily)